MSGAGDHQVFRAEPSGHVLLRVRRPGVVPDAVHHERSQADGAALLHHYFIRLGFLPGWRAIVEPADVPTVFGELERRLDERAAVHGSLDLTVPAACFVATPR